MSCLVRDLFTCQKCGVVEPRTSRLEADHIQRHLGDPKLFWELDNLQCLCKSCHAKDKQREEAQDRAIGRVGGV
ncbi:HNH endonuclease [Phaeobacter sp. C3_T13_0]